MKTKAIALGLLLLALALAPSCRVRRAEVVSEQLEAEATEATSLALDHKATSGLTISRSSTQWSRLGLRLTEYRPDGSVERVLEAVRLEGQMGADSLQHSDSLALTERRQRVRAVSVQSRRKSKTHQTQTSLPPAWWLYIIGAIVVGVWVWRGLRPICRLTHKTIKQ